MVGWLMGFTSHLLALPYGIGITIAFAELAWGFIKYYLAPTPSQRREAVEEFYGVVIGAILTATVAYYMSIGLSIGASIAGAMGVNVPQVPLQDIYSVMYGDFNAVMRQYIANQVLTFAFSAAGAILGATQVLKPIGSLLGSLSGFLNAIMAPYNRALVATMMNTIALAALGQVMGYMYNYGVGSLSVALLLPSRTRRIGAWLASFILVFSVLLPMVAGYQDALVFNYGNVFTMWISTIEQHCSNNAILQAILSLFLNAPSWLKNAINIMADFVCGITSLQWLVTNTATLVSTGTFNLLEGDIIIDIVMGIGFAITAWLADLIEAGARALFEVRHL
jgi:hypothetical protein